MQAIKLSPIWMQDEELFWPIKCSIYLLQRQGNWHQGRPTWREFPPALVIRSCPVNRRPTHPAHPTVLALRTICSLEKTLILNKCQHYQSKVQVRIFWIGFVLEKICNIHVICEGKIWWIWCPWGWRPRVIAHQVGHTSREKYLDYGLIIDVQCNNWFII